MLRLAIVLGVFILLAGCSLLPDVRHEPTVHNPFPQLTKVAVVPFINASAERSVDGRQFALAYSAELQLIPGFEVAPMGVAEVAMLDHHLDLAKPADCRRLAQMLDVDAVVIGTVTDFSPYYPPRCAMHVEWFAANPGFHPIPPGYGLPWGTPEEEDIPKSLVQESEMALAREQLKTQTPAYQKEPPPATPAMREKTGVRLASDGAALSPSGEISSGPSKSPAKSAGPSASGSSGGSAGGGSPTVADGAGPTPAPGSSLSAAPTHSVTGEPEIIGGPPPGSPGGLPRDWPDPRGFIPPPPSCMRPELHPSDEPVMQYTHQYMGADPEFTAALQNYVAFRDDARFGGWTAYLQRSDDFIRFCCHMHISAMLTARGGAGETRVVLRWPESRYIP